jgi:uncharacterized protein (TIGR01777 family)
MSPSLTRRVRLPVPAGAAFEWHERPGAFERLSPPWERVEVVERSGGIRDGGRVVLRAGPLRSRWTLVHRGYVAGVRFEDVQESGPFARWRHVHSFHDTAGGSELEDAIEFGLPGGALGDAIAGPWMRTQLDRTFDYRNRVLHDDLEAHARAGASRMRIAVTGGTGLIGSALIPFLTTGGHEVIRLVRHAPSSAGEVQWDPGRGIVTRGSLEGLDAVVHLAGVGIADARWTAQRRRALQTSRIDATRHLVASLASLRRPPRVLISASAMGIYGSRGGEILREDAPPGSGFLAELARHWEEEALAAERSGVRVVLMRTGLVLSPRGGLLPPLLRVFRLGAGGPLANGEAWWSWVAIDDWIGLAYWAMTRDAVRGPVNVSAPAPSTNAEFSRVLGRVLHRPALIPAPRFAILAVFGDMGREAILASQRMEPARALASGYPFRFRDLESALRHELGLPASNPAQTA